MDDRQPLVRTLMPCQVPWMVSPSMSGFILTHAGSDDEHECSIVFGGGRLTEAGHIDSRRIEINFRGCERSTSGLLPDDADLERRGYALFSEARSVPINEYRQWLISRWRASGICPESGLWVSTSSPSEALQKQAKLYVLAGRNGYAEIIATGFSWREWIWADGHREALADTSATATGTGVE